ncbi:GntR family transcriptional regulator [Dactylosporangium sp. NBC_01737]|uniref:GntR family transcriptional regulator n=1 Tax=Dactylosporangium sp. NBC_01737 TaxID=2975959 RepID=UPI002E0EC652|nr:GntR family transcriptional regulator [Dactylosporangium sp. NBC_01737]
MRDQISSGRYPPGAVLPTEDSIGRLYGVGRMSVRRAVAVLRHEGLIVTGRGMQALVRSQPKRMFLGIAGSDMLVARMPTPPESRRLELTAGVPVLEITRDDGSVEVFPADRYGAHGAQSG